MGLVSQPLQSPDLVFAGATTTGRNEG